MNSAKSHPHLYCDSSSASPGSQRRSLITIASPTVVLTSYENLNSIYLRRKANSPPVAIKTLDKFRPSLEVVPATPGPNDEEDGGVGHCPRRTGGGPKFILPQIRDPECPNARRVEEKLKKAAESGSTYLQVPPAAPRRRHSWICGYATCCSHSCSSCCYCCCCCCCYCCCDGLPAVAAN